MRPHTTQSNTADAIVIGAGLHGCSAALHLAMRGMSVIVLEKDYTGRHASGVNAGGVRRLGRALPEIPLAVASAKMWENIEALVDDDCGFQSSCQIKIAETEEALNDLKNRAAQVRNLGYEHEQIVDQAQLRELLPAVAPHCVGGMVVDGDGHANPYRTTQAFRLKCQSLGVRFVEGAEVTKITRKNNVWFISTPDTTFEAPNLVNCAGAWGGKISSLLGEPVPIEARAPMLMITARMPKFVTPVVGVQGRTLSFKQFDNGTVLIGGGYEGRADPNTNKTYLDYGGLAENAQTAISVFPIMKKARVVRSWAGIEGVMPDKIPVLGRSQVDGAFHAFGFSAHGFQLGPVCGQIISDLIFEGKSKEPIEAFGIERFRHNA